MRTLFDTVLTFLRQWESDKWIHTIAFLLLAWAVARVLMCCDGIAAYGTAVPKIIGAVVSAALAVGKECYDKKTQGLFDRQDLWASWVGVGLYLMMDLL